MRWRGAAILLLAGAAAIWGARYEFVSVRKDLAEHRDAIADHWSRVEAALTRRADAIPVLLEAIRKHSDTSPAVLEEIAAARSRLAEARGPQEKIRANQALSLSIARLLLHCESDPKTRTGAGFRQLQDELRAREDEIASERFQYNNALEHYNARMKRFPVNIVASLAGFSRNDAYFSTGPDPAPALTHPK
jgi:LemA protein